MASECNAKMGETYARARRHTHTRTRIDTKTKAPVHLCVSLTERTGHIIFNYIYEDVGFWRNCISLHIQILTFPQINNIGIVFE